MIPGSTVSSREYSAARLLSVRHNCDTLREEKLENEQRPPIREPLFFRGEI